MAKTKQRRRRKHRGSQTGRIDRTGRTSRPKSRQQARAQAKSRQEAKRDRPPTWRGAIQRAALAAGVFFVVVAFGFRQPIGSSLGLAALMMGLYVPMGYTFDGFFYRRRMAARQRAAQKRD